MAQEEAIKENTNRPSVKKAEGESNKNHKERKYRTKANVVELVTRVIVRQLPPTMTEAEFLEAIAPIPAHSEFYYVNGDLNLGEFAFSRAYIKFTNTEELLIFKDKYDNYVFMDAKGNEYPAIVEYAPLQKMPRRFGSTNIKQDGKVNTIESDPDYIAFVEEVNNSGNAPPAPSTDALLEEIESRETKENIPQTTPLVDFLNKKVQEKLKFKEEKKRKKEEVKKKKIEESKMIRDKKFKEREKERKEITGGKSEVVKKVSPAHQPTKVEKNNETKTTKPNEVAFVVKVKNDSDKVSSVSNKETKETSSMKESKLKERAETKGAKEPNRIRNKDRPAREIYRPGMAKQSRLKQPQSEPVSSSNKSEPTASSEATTDHKTTTNGQSNNSTTTNSNPKPTQTNHHKFKYRVFTNRTKNT